MFSFNTPSPSPSDIPSEPWEATPGVEGFLLGFFVLGIALAFLMWSMNRHLRKIKHAATSEQNRIAEQRASAATDTPTPDPAADEPHGDKPPGADPQA